MNVINGTGTISYHGMTAAAATMIARELANDHREAFYVYDSDGEPVVTVYPNGTKFAVIHEAGGEGKIVSRHKYQRTAETACQKRNRLANARVYAIKVVYP